MMWSDYLPDDDYDCKDDVDIIGNHYKVMYNFKFNSSGHENNSNNNSNNSIKQKQKIITNVNTKKCYTCHPRGLISNHIISKTDTVTFSHDIWKRPLIIVTTNNHYGDLTELDEKTLMQCFKDMKEFTTSWNLNDYQLQINHGSWKTHHHLHFKVKVNEQLINRMRRDHFTMKKYEQRYNN